MKATTMVFTIPAVALLLGIGSYHGFEKGQENAHQPEAHYFNFESDK